MWLARDKDGSLSENKPKLCGSFYCCGGSFIDGYLFPEVTFENSPVELKIK